jgi:hypothetical protein
LAALALWGGLGLALAPAAHAQSQEEARAIFLFNFARFVEWPPAVFADGSAPLTIGVVGDRDVARALERYVKGKDANGRDIAVRALESAAGSAECQIVYVGDKRLAAAVIGEVAGKPVLTVGEEEDFITSGGVIRLFAKDNKVLCAINTKAADAAGLKLGDKLVRASS